MADDDTEPRSDAPLTPVGAGPEQPAATAETESAGKNPETGEIGGPKGPEPTRYGDWEKNGRCYDF